MGEQSPRRRAHARSQVRAYAIATCVVAATSAILVASCSEPGRVVLGYDLDDSGSPPAFTDSTEAGSDVTASSLITYCPSSNCPAGHTTCPDSIFACDVNLKTDIRNCGACGVACPRGDRFSTELFSCVDGRCVMACVGNTNGDCDGVTDNGCERQLIDDDNCGGCDVKCLDPEKPCIFNEATSARQCGCPAGMKPCATFPQCVRVEDNDAHCGACDNKCAPEGDGGLRPPHTYFGCLQSTCGKLKCEPGWCDGDDDIKGTGCETELGTDTNCAACGDDCLLKGQTCLLTPSGGRLPPSTPYCGCPEGQTFCGSCDSGGVIIVPGGGDGGLTFPLPPVCRGLCIDLTNDVDNCGVCGLKCNGSCEYGSCVQHCPYGRADCDGNPDCEVNTLSDPQNCGGCGIVCDAVAGQACVEGRCVVEPCDQNDGGLTR